MFVHFVGDHVSVVFLGKLDDIAQLFPREDLATRVARITDDNGFCALGKGPPEFVTIELESRWTKFDIDRLCTGQNRVRAVVLIEGRKHDHLVVWIHQTHQTCEHCFRTAARHYQVGLRTDRIAQPVFKFSGQCAAEILCAPRDGVLMKGAVNCLVCGLKKFCWWVEIGKALREIDRSAFVTSPSHFANDGLGEPLGTQRGLDHGTRYIAQPNSDAGSCPSICATNHSRTAPCASRRTTRPAVPSGTAPCASRHDAPCGPFRNGTLCIEARRALRGPFRNGTLCIETHDAPCAVASGANALLDATVVKERGSRSSNDSSIRPMASIWCYPAQHVITSESVYAPGSSSLKSLENWISLNPA